MEQGTFAGWLKEDGDRVNPGDPLFVLESDKAAQDIESLDAGILRIPPDGPIPGEEVKVGQVLAYLVAEGEIAPTAPAGQKAPRAAPPGARGGIIKEGLPQITQATREETPTAPAVRRKQAISPRARRVAAELGVDWGGLKGSGRNGRIR